MKKNKVEQDNILAELSFGFFITFFKATYKNMMNEIYEILSYFDKEIVHITKDLNK